MIFVFLYIYQGGGTIADLFPTSRRGLPLTIFAATPFMGPVAGNIIGKLYLH